MVQFVNRQTHQPHHLNHLWNSGMLTTSPHYTKKSCAITSTAVGQSWTRKSISKLGWMFTMGSLDNTFIVCLYFLFKKLLANLGLLKKNKKNNFWLCDSWCFKQLTWCNTILLILIWIIVKTGNDRAWTMTVVWESMKKHSWHLQWHSFCVWPLNQKQETELCGETVSSLVWFVLLKLFCTWSWWFPPRSSSLRDVGRGEEWKRNVNKQTISRRLVLALLLCCTSFEAL